MKLVAFALLVACTSAPPPAASNDGGIWLHAYSYHTTTVDITTGGDAWVSFETQKQATCPPVVTSGACHAYEVCSGESTIVGPHRAGTVTVTGAAVPISMMPNADNLYGWMESSKQALFAGGEQLTVSATGDEVPAFTASLTAPSKATITSPTIPADGSGTIDRASDLPLA